METNSTNPSLAGAGEENEKPSSKKVYSAPQLRAFGSLTELTNLLPNRGADGCTMFLDCTFT